MELFDFEDLDEKDPCEDLLIDADQRGVLRGRCLDCQSCLAWILRRGRGGAQANSCQECGCPAERHLDLTPWLEGLFESQARVLSGPSYKSQWSVTAGTLLKLEEDETSAGDGNDHVVNPLLLSIPMVAYTRWSQIEARLFVHTAGLFNPLHWMRPATKAQEGPLRSPPAQGASPHPDEVLVSVICPTMQSRRPFHKLLYECFQRQTHPKKELIVVETGIEPSAELKMISARDPRVKHCHFSVLERFWPVGLKRNIGCYVAQGEVILHFDDDDLYGSGYMAHMLREVLAAGRSVPDARLEGRSFADDDVPAPTGLPPAAATLSSWHFFDLHDGTFGYLDAEHDPDVTGMRDGWVYGWGFSFAYTKSAWEVAPFAEVTHNEDYEFLCPLRARGVPIALPREAPGAGLCAHSRHAVSSSGGEFGGARHEQRVVQAPPALAPLVPLLEAALVELPRCRLAPVSPRDARTQSVPLVPASLWAPPQRAAMGWR